MNADAPFSNPDILTAAAQDVLAERERQKTVEGWCTSHDDSHDEGQMALAAACYAWAGHTTHPIFQKRMIDFPSQHGSDDEAPLRRMWVWDRKWWKPKSRRENLVRAGALLLAEIERLDRAAVKDKTNG